MQVICDLQDLVWEIAVGWYAPSVRWSSKDRESSRHTRNFARFRATVVFCTYPLHKRSPAPRAFHLSYSSATGETRCNFDIPMQ